MIAAGVFDSPAPGLLGCPACLETRCLRVTGARKVLESNCLRPTGLKNSSNTIEQGNENRIHKNFTKGLRVQLRPNPLASNLQSSAHVYVRVHSSKYINYGSWGACDPWLPLMHPRMPRAGGKGGFQGGKLVIRVKTERSQSSPNSPFLEPSAPLPGPVALLPCLLTPLGFLLAPFWMIFSSSERQLRSPRAMLAPKSPKNASRSLPRTPPDPCFPAGKLVFA